MQSSVTSRPLEPSVDAWQGVVWVRAPFSALEVCRAIPDHRGWDDTRRAWYCRPTERNLAYLREAFPDQFWTPAARKLYDEHVAEPQRHAAELLERKRVTGFDKALLDDYVGGGPPPFEHQRRAFFLSRDEPAFALFMEQRTGKTRVIIDTACWLFEHDKIDAVVVVAPNTVKSNWVTDELPTHHPERVSRVAAWWSSSANAEQARDWERATSGPTPVRTLRWLVVNVEALSGYLDRRRRGALFPQLERFMRHQRTLLVVDESTRIKTPGAQRTRAVLALGRLAPYRRVLTGTPAAKGPLGLYTQLGFLDPKILGFNSFYTFRNHFAIMGGWNGKQVLGYRHLDELQRRIEPYSFRVTRDQCFDLPPVGYQKLVVELTTEQRRAYDTMRDQMLAAIGDGVASAPIVLTQLLRLQQIVGGFLPLAFRDGDGTEWTEVQAIPGGNPKLTALLDLVEDVDGKVLIWTWFRPEIALIAAALREKYGDATVVELRGGMNDDERVLARTAFQDPDSQVRFLVGQTATGGIGLNLSQARTVVYFSNSFDLEARDQSEDRAVGPGQKHSVAYVDLVARDTVDDKKILPALREKQNVATQLQGDAWRSWI